MKTLYYTVEKHLESDCLNGLKTLSVYAIENNVPKLQFEVECSSDSLGNYLYSNSEEIQEYLDNNDFDEEFNLEQL